MNSAIDRASHRRGVLMLVVVSMLTLFLLLGTTYLVVAARAKQAARAQARLALDSPSVGIAPPRLLDAVLLKTIRGGLGGVSEPTANGGILAGLSCSGTFESLLADKYGEGQTKTGVVTAITSISGSTSSPLLTGTLHVSGVQAADLPGRVLTILGSNREPTSHRIISSSTGGGSFTVVLSTPTRRRAFVMPSPPVDAVLNGLEFDGVGGNEPYDAFDDKNVFLTHVSPKDKANSPSDQTVASSKVWRFGYLSSGTNATLRTLSGSTASNGMAYGADNDNDGTPDGFFLDFGLPSVSAPNGVGTIDFHASVLVVDLDSRFNVNAHGSLTPIAYPIAALTGSNCPGWPTGPDAPSPGTIPVGSGYGPPEVNAGWMFPQSSYTGAERSRRMRGPGDPDYTNNDNAKGNQDNDTVVPSFSYVLSGADESAQRQQNRPNTSRFSPKQPLPRMRAMEGRYGEGQDFSKFVSNSTDVPTQQSSGAWTALSASTFPLARPGAPNTNDTLSLIRDAQATPVVSGSSGTATVTDLGAGVPSVWWSGSASFNWAAPSNGTPRQTYNSPPDLHGTMLTTTATAKDVVPRLIFAKPDWRSGETTDDPYELRLDVRSARNGSTTTTGTSWDNVFGYADLEGVLRQYDVDAQQLSRRLLQILGPASEEARLRVTTDGWDTTTITGSAATTIRAWLNEATPPLSGTSSVSGVIANEVARGERLNLNRPLTAAKPAGYDATDPYYVQRQAFFKDLYTLLTALGVGATSAERAQWAANVVEFRDADSTMTPFEYDHNPQNGWMVDGDVTNDEGGDRRLVWGAERPELLLTESFAWENTPQNKRGMLLSLVRPWNATALSSGTRIPGEPCDVALETDPDNPVNVVDLSKRPSAGSSFPVWRLRIESGGTQYIRLDTTTPAANEFSLATLTPAPVLGADKRLALASGTTVASGSTSGVATIVSGSTPVYVINNLSLSGGSGTIFLERLSDPAAALTGASGTATWNANTLTSATSGTASICYVTVDSIPIQRIETGTITTSGTFSAFARATSSTTSAFWKTGTSFSDVVITTSGSVSNVPRQLSAGSTAWFVWPNRPFVSAAELFLVPQGDSVAMLNGYTKPTAADNDLLTLCGTAKLPLFMEAVHVPSRFVGIHTTINASGTGTLASYGIYPETAPINQLSSYREPGRVNLNTITTDDVWNAVVAGSLAKSGTANPVKTGSAANFANAPATSLLNLLALSSSGTTAIKDTDTDLTAIQPRNPLHEIYTATRLANTATTRSNVFAIWVTVRESIAGDPDSVKLHRGFYIVDRSIPVAYDPGKDHNVWDCVVLRRIIE